MELKLNPGLDFTVVELTDQWSCVVIDDFLANPAEVVALACEQRDDFTYPARAYPGGVLNLTARQLEPVHRFIRREMSNLFPFCRGGIQIQSQICLTTLLPESFTWVQRLCHTDPGAKPGRVNFASVLYLFDEPALGGTAFFEWKNADYWRQMTARQQSDPAAGLEELQQRFAMFRDPPCYMAESNEAGELLDAVPAKFNRFIFYAGDMPHGASITRPELLTNDPATGRLTLNTFVSAQPE